MVTVKVDSKGRLAIPARIRGEIDMKPGDIFILEVEDEILRLTKAKNPFDALGHQAIEE